MTRNMKHINEWATFTKTKSIDEIEKTIYSLFKELSNLRSTSKMPEIYSISNDLVIGGEIEKDDFFIYSANRNLFVLFYREGSKYYFKDCSYDQNSKPTEIYPLKFTTIKSWTSDSQKLLDVLKDSINYRVYAPDNNILFKDRPQLSISLDRNLDQLPDIDVKMEDVNQQFRDEFERKYFHKSFNFQVASEVYYAPGKKDMLVQLCAMPITEIRLYLGRQDKKLLPYLKFFTESIYNQDCVIIMGYDFKPATVDLEEDLNNGLKMIPIKKKNEFPYSNFYYVTFADYSCQKMFEDLADFLYGYWQHINDKQDRKSDDSKKGDDLESVE